MLDLLGNCDTKYVEIDLQGAFLDTSRRSCSNEEPERAISHTLYFNASQKVAHYYSRFTMVD
jgi:hypothetical protein